MFFAYCKKVPFFASEGDNLVISSNKVFLKTGGEKATITIIGFRANGEIMHDHTSVIMTSSLGSLNPVELEMFDGKGSVEFISGDTAGEAEIKARSGNIVSEPITISITKDTLTKLYLSANPTNIPFGGGRTMIKVLAVDGTGNPIADVPVVIRSSNGSFESGNSVYMTNSQGTAEDYLTVTETATVKAVSGEISSDDLTVTVEDEVVNTLPVAQFVISPSSPQKGELIYFNGSLSSDSDGYIVSWEWDFGDGTTARGEKVNHKYNWDGSVNKTFTAVLKVKDNLGGVHSQQKDITVSDL